VGNQSLRLNAAYIERKRLLLTKLRNELQSTTDVAEADESNTNTESNLQAREYEDDAQKLDTLEKEGNLVARDVARLAQVMRALKKIEEGSYGIKTRQDSPIQSLCASEPPIWTYTLRE
jgi:DnaK suppressor protein